MLMLSCRKQWFGFLIYHTEPEHDSLGRQWMGGGGPYHGKQRRRGLLKPMRNTGGRDPPGLEGLTFHGLLPGGVGDYCGVFFPGPQLFCAGSAR